MLAGFESLDSIVLLFAVAVDRSARAGATDAAFFVFLCCILGIVRRRKSLCIERRPCRAYIANLVRRQRAAQRVSSVVVVLALGLAPRPATSEQVR